MLPCPVTKTLADLIEDVLPQTQCTKCGYNGCRPYAEAIAAGEAEINQCPPGGMEGVMRLARLIALILQDAGDQVANIVFVVNNQNIECH